MTIGLMYIGFGTYMLSSMYLLKGLTCKLIRAIENDKLERIIDNNFKIVAQERVDGAIKKIEHAFLYPTPIDFVMLGKIIYDNHKSQEGK